MHISGLLEQKGSFVATIHSDATIIEVTRELHKQRVGALVISKDGRSIDGIVSERDIVGAIGQFGPAILDSPVKMIMTDVIRTCSPDDEVDSLAAIMTENRIRHVPVSDNGVLVGIVSIGDIVKTRLDQLEQDRDALEQYITAR